MCKHFLGYQKCCRVCKTTIHIPVISKLFFNVCLILYNWKKLFTDYSKTHHGFFIFFLPFPHHSRSKTIPAQCIELCIKYHRSYIIVIYIFPFIMLIHTFHFFFALIDHNIHKIFQLLVFQNQQTS